MGQLNHPVLTCAWERHSLQRMSDWQQSAPLLGQLYVLSRPACTAASSNCSLQSSGDDCRTCTLS